MGKTEHISGGREVEAKAKIEIEEEGEKACVLASFIARINRQHRITIPSCVMLRLELRDGDHVYFNIVGLIPTALSRFEKEKKKKKEE